MTLAQIELAKMFADLGSTVLITVMLVFFAYKLINKFGLPFIESQQKIAEAMGQQAQCMTDIQTTVNDYVRRENNDHREILLSMQVVVGEIKGLKQEVRKQHDSNEFASS